MSQDRSPVEVAVYYLKIAVGIILALLLLIIVGAVAAYTAPDDVAYSEDHFTVANSSNGEQVVITYEVQTSLKENAESETRAERMDEMAEVAACANARLDEYIQQNSEQRIRNVNLQEVTISCETGEVSVERIQVAGGTV